MNGPHNPGTFVFPNSSNQWESKNLRRGLRYRVVTEFADADGDKHVAGAEWEFIGAMFDRQSDQLTLCVRQDDAMEWQIPLIWKPAAQQSVIEGFKSIVMPIEFG